MSVLKFNPIIATFFALLGFVFYPHQTFAEVDKAHIEAGKKATALVEIRTEKGIVNASAFCIDVTGVFVTNDHVASAARTGDRIDLILNAGTAAQRSLVAKVVRTDARIDLAILRVDRPGELNAIELASDATLATLIETSQVTSFGYPLGGYLAMRKGAQPEVSIAVSRITSLRHDQGQLELIQLDGALNPGNSGGPVVDEHGNVIGIVAAGIPGAQIAFAIPANRVRQLLSNASVAIVPKVLTDRAGSSLSGETYGPRLPIPEESARLAAVSALHEVYAKQYADIKPQTKWALASILLDRGIAMNDDRAGRYVALRESLDIAIVAGDFLTCIRAINCLAHTYDVSAVDLKADLITKLAPRLKKPEDSAQIAAHGLLTAKALAQRESYTEALQLVPLVRTALVGQSPSLITSVRAQLALLEAQAADFELVKPSLEKLKTAPNDPQANLAAGRFYCFSRAEFERGLPLLAHGSDFNLAALAKKDLAGADQPDACASLGDQWWELAERTPGAKPVMQNRAALWYRRALPGLAGLAKDKTTHRLAEVSPPAQIIVVASEEEAASVQAAGMTIVIEALIDGDSTLHLTPTGLYWKSGGNASKPGMHEKRDEPTYVNAIPWRPKWTKRGERGADTSDVFPLKIGNRLDFRVEVIGCAEKRGSTTIEQRDAIRSDVVKGEFVVSIPDSQIGSRWYRLRVSREP